MDDSGPGCMVYFILMLILVTISWKLDRVVDAIHRNTDVTLCLAEITNHVPNPTCLKKPTP